MKVAIPVWEGGLSPVFDVAGRLLIVEVRDGREVLRYEAPFPEEGLLRRASHLVELRVDVLVCGAISRDLEALLRVQRIQVIPWVTGDPERVLAAFCAGELPSPRFAMPGAPFSFDPEEPGA